MCVLLSRLNQFSFVESVGHSPRASVVLFYQLRVLIVVHIRQLNILHAVRTFYVDGWGVNCGVQDPML